MLCRMEGLEASWLEASCESALLRRQGKGIPPSFTSFICSGDAGVAQMLGTGAVVRRDARASSPGCVALPVFNTCTGAQVSCLAPLLHALIGAFGALRGLCMYCPRAYWSMMSCTKAPRVGDVEPPRAARAPGTFLPPYTGPGRQQCAVCGFRRKNTTTYYSLGV